MSPWARICAHGEHILDALGQTWLLVCDTPVYCCLGRRYTHLYATWVFCGEVERDLGPFHANRPVLLHLHHNLRVLLAQPSVEGRDTHASRLLPLSVRPQSPGLCLGTPTTIALNAPWSSLRISRRYTRQSCTQIPFRLKPPFVFLRRSRLSTFVETSKLQRSFQCMRACSYCDALVKKEYKYALSYDCKVVRGTWYLVADRYRAIIA